MQTNITITDNCTADEFLQTVRVNGLQKYNMEQTNGKMAEPYIEITRVARDGENTIVGGISAFTYLSTLEIEILWVSEAHRGQGIAGELLALAEADARAVGCRLAHLTTFSFQAPQFYLNRGYAICGEVDGFPDEINLYLLKKQL